MKASDIIAVVVIILVVQLIAYPMIKKIRKRETCCGTTKEKTPKKRLNRVAGKYVLSIEGMRCKNCERQVAKAINAIEGLSAKVSLEKNEAVISYEESPLEKEAVEAIQKLDFLAAPKTSERG
ncbi:MAG: heavy-metal-associated domain-containing protein [Treponemataceae bacterium]|nr:heavy-metal-associated domain-containing protein [Treponemataceae bacterium]